jgi:hypothetical protein
LFFSLLSNSENPHTAAHPGRKPWKKSNECLVTVNFRIMYMVYKPIHFKLLAVMVSVICASSLSARGQSSASGSLNLDSLTVTPLSGTISGWSGWSLDAVSTALNSSGGFNQNYDFENSPTTTATASASVAYATASASATATSLDTSAISGQASGSVLIPGGINESASVSGGYGNYASLEASFTLSQATSVSFGALITAAQSMETDANGQVLENELIFNLNVDGSTVLFYDSPLTLGPSSTYESGPSVLPENNSIDLSAGSHDLFIELDDEQQVLEVPEPSTYLLLRIPLGAGFLRRLPVFAAVRARRAVPVDKI